MAACHFGTGPALEPQHTPTVSVLVGPTHGAEDKDHAEEKNSLYRLHRGFWVPPPNGTVIPNCSKTPDRDLENFKKGPSKHGAFEAWVQSGAGKWG